MPKKNLAVAAVLLAVLIVASSVYASMTIKDSRRNEGLVLESFSPMIYCETITGGTL
jgi:hypothetical protein